MDYSPMRLLPPNYPVLGSNFVSCSLVGTLHDECRQGVLLVKEYRVFGREQDVGILQPSTTSPHLAVVQKTKIVSST